MVAFYASSVIVGAHTSQQSFSSNRLVAILWGSRAVPESLETHWTITAPPQGGPPSRQRELCRNLHFIIEYPILLRAGDVTDSELSSSTETAPRSGRLSSDTRWAEQRYRPYHFTLVAQKLKVSWAISFNNLYKTN